MKLVSNIQFAFAAGLLVAAVLGSNQPLAAADFKMKFGTATLNEDQHQFIKIFKEEVEKASAGKIEVEIYPQSQLGTIQRHIEGLQLGTIEGFVGPADFYVGIDPRFGVFSTPFLFRDRLHAAAVVRDGELNKEIRELAASKGMVGLAVYAMAQHDYLGKTPFLSLDDFKGKKIRVNATVLERTAMSKLGASAAPMSLGEVLPNLQRGVIDGTRSALSIFVSFKYHDVAQTVTVTNDTQIIPIAMVSKVWFDKLPADLQKAVIDAGIRAQQRNQEWADEFHKDMPKKWEALGGKLVKLSDSDQKKLVELLTPVGDEVTKENPVVRTMLDRVRNTAKKY